MREFDAIDLILCLVILFDVIFFVALYWQNLKNQRLQNIYAYNLARFQSPDSKVPSPPNVKVLELPIKGKRKGSVYAPSKDIDNQMRGNVIDMYD